MNATSFLSLSSRSRLFSSPCIYWGPQGRLVGVEARIERGYLRPEDMPQEQAEGEEGNEVEADYKKMADDGVLPDNAETSTI
ncbi:hypothetical protein FBZ93_1259 [Bradyrhizobium macuxiense]|uniref:Uncharacterized protein n=1 Tax=Bradyrhizobium macuxiense TaxID=1755647 RepID=A0A560KUD5_9BRAD|nr:hypothetical protein [Bradyrhizobium macuxiense]TWB86883.1 hypothetical protein FBZ93_1259 [Bradyrhizobium macuxiense]